MVQSVELLFDPETELAVTAQWSVLADAGLPSQARHTGATNRPHVTLAVARALTPDQEAAIGAAVSAVLPVPARVGGLLVFGPGPFILCRLVVPSAALLELQRRVVAAIGPTVDAFGHQQPGAWTPHVTLARRMTAEQLAGAIRLLSPVADLPATGERVRRWNGERKIAWTVGAAAASGSGWTGADQNADDVGDHHGDGAQE